MASLLSLENTDISLENENIGNDFKKKRGKAKYYDEFCSFRSFKIAQKTLSGVFLDHKWVIKRTTDSREGEKKWYQCSIKKCPVFCQLVLSKDSLSRVVLLISDNEHHHEEDAIEPKLNLKGIEPKTKEKIDELNSLSVKPGRILIQLRKLGLEVPTTTQLYNYLKNSRKVKLGSSVISLNDLKE